MRFNKEDLLLYAVTDKRWLKEGETLADQVEKACMGGVTFVQLKDMEADRPTLAKEAIEIKEVCGRYGVPFVVNDNISVAIEAGADGIHIGQDGMDIGKVRELLGPEKIIGVSASNPEEARKAMENGANYLGSGAVFPTAAYKTVKPLPKEMLQAICGSVDIPIIAMGGIDETNVLSLKGTGIAGVAVGTAIFGSEDIEEAAARLQEIAAKEVVG